jgi:hypothetical protein
MKLVTESGLWRAGPRAAPVPLAAVLEVDGAVLSWTVDQPADSEPQITFTNPARADWLWRVVGEDGHRALAAGAAAASPDATGEIDLAGVEVRPGSLDGLRRLAVGHWLRRWWPASVRDGIAGLNAAVLDAEIAVATAGADEFFGDGTLDSDVPGLLAPHAEELRTQLLLGDPRIIDLVRRCVDLADEFGVDGPGWPELAETLAGGATSTPVSARRDDYALAAGRGGGPEPAEVIARGVVSMAWGGVPGGVFDAADGTVDWTVAVEETGPVALVRTAVVGPGSPIGIPVNLRHNGFHATGALDENGRTALSLVGEDNRPPTAHEAWDVDWSGTAVTVGVDVEEGPEVRDRVRRFARQRLIRPQPDAYLAEILAAESDY